jgi:hypothetical protein
MVGKSGSKLPEASAATTPGARLELELDQPEQRRPHLVTILRDTRPVLNGDSEPMMEVWSHGQDVTAMHSAPGRQVGWEEVRAAWEQFASLTSGARHPVA